MAPEPEQFPTPRAFPDTDANHLLAAALVLEDRFPELEAMVTVLRGLSEQIMEEAHRE